MKRIIVALLVGALLSVPAFAVAAKSTPTPTEKRLAKQVANLNDRDNLSF